MIVLLGFDGAGPVDYDEAWYARFFPGMAVTGVTELRIRAERRAAAMINKR